MHQSVFGCGPAARVRTCAGYRAARVVAPYSFRVSQRKHVVFSTGGAPGSSDSSDLLGGLKQAAASVAADAQKATQDASVAVSDVVGSTAASVAGAVSSAAQGAVVALVDQVQGQLASTQEALVAALKDGKAQHKSKAQAASVVDNLAASVITGTQKVKEVLAAAGAIDAVAAVDAALGAFSSRASAIRSKLDAGGASAETVLSELSAAVSDVLNALRAAVGVPAAELAPPPPPPAPATPATPDLATTIKDYLQLWATLGALYYLDKGIKHLLLQAGIKFPSALAGMFGVFALLCAVGDAPAAKVLQLFAPALTWIARWLPLFYVPALVTLPLALNGIPGADLARIVSILGFGMVGTLLFTAQTTVMIREAINTPVKPIPKAKPAPPFTAAHYTAWGAIAVVSTIATLLGGAGSELAVRMALPLGLAATVGGYLVGELVPKGLHGVLHPVVVTAVVANAGAALHGALTGWDYNQAQQAYLAKGAGPLGAGDALMSLLGVVIISFGFRIYTQRDTMKRHAPEIFGATILSSLFSLFSTAFAAKAIGLPADLARALIPRSVTVALALPISSLLDAPLAITAAAVLLQGILGANFGPGLMTQVGIKDTIARGLAAAGTAGGLGTASLTSKEPEALPFCALSYALVGIFSTLITSVPAVRDLLVALVA